MNLRVRKMSQGGPAFAPVIVTVRNGLKPEQIIQAILDEVSAQLGLQLEVKALPEVPANQLAGEFPCDFKLEGETFRC